jgi:sarcosine oxidase subunit beta
VLVDAGTLGKGASGRAAGMVRAQGGTETAIRLGMFSKDFYRGQAAALGIDSGFVSQGYYIPAFSENEVVIGKARVQLQQSLGVDVTWVGPEEFDAGNPAMSPGHSLGASYSPTDGYLDPPRNVLAYTAALFTHGVDVRERTALTGLITEGGRVTGVRTTDGDIYTDRVVIAGGAQLQELGTVLGARIWAAGARHQVVVTAAHPDLAPSQLPMVFDLPSGIYWRPEEGGMMWGMSNPDEAPGVATEFDWAYYEIMRERVAALVPITKDLGLRRAWAGTIDYTPDHLPILGPVITDDGPIAGTTIASAAGHGMMWGPGVSRAAADLAVTGTTELLDVTDLGIDRFDTEGRSRLATDPIALPFPERITA